MKKQDVFFLNDYRHYNDRYRGALMNICRNNGFHVHSLGMFEEFWNFIRVIFSGAPIVSSNMRTNLVVMLANPKRGLIIINGLTRWRRLWLLRFVLRVLINCSRMTICVQNYADYRYFQRFCDARVVWVPGSGGERRLFGTQARAVVVTRPRKIVCQADWLTLFSEHYGMAVSLVGCDESDSILSGFDFENIEVQGYVDQKDIFVTGNSFLQLPGFGEGVPHSLVDAMCSGMPIWMTKIEFLQFGFNKLGMSLAEMGPFGSLIYSDESAAKVGQDVVCAEYFREALQSFGAS